MAETTMWNPGCDCGGAFLSGTVPPVAAQGENGDFYLDFSVYDLYGPKTAGQWPTPPVSLTGPAGVGAQGPAGPAGQQGIQGPKGNKGDTGATGPAGADGAIGPQGPAGADGSQIYADVIDPVDIDGNPGDYWLNKTTSTLWGPKDEFTFWVGTSLNLKGDTGPQGPAGADGMDQPILDLDLGQQIITNNTSSSIAVLAAIDPTLISNADYSQVTGVFDAIPHGINNGVTQQSNQLTIARSGVYNIRVWCNVSASTNNVSVSLKFAVNGSIPPLRRANARLGNAGEKTNLAAYGFISLAAGDVLTLWHACTGATNITYHDLVFSVNELIATGLNVPPWQDEGIEVLAEPTAVNFTGAGVTVTDVGGVATVTIPGGGGGSGVDVQDETAPVITATTLNFTGAGVTATDAGGGVADVTIPGEVHLGDVVSVVAGVGTEVDATDPANPIVKASSFRLGAFFAGTLDSSEKLMKFVFTDSVTIPDDFAGAVLHAGVAATANTVIDIQKNGVSIGSVTVSAAGTSGAFVTTGAAENFVSGDRLSFIAPGTADATLADISITLEGTRTA